MNAVRPYACGAAAPYQLLPHRICRHQQIVKTWHAHIYVAFDSSPKSSFLKAEDASGALAGGFCENGIWMSSSSNAELSSIGDNCRSSI